MATVAMPQPALRQIELGHAGGVDGGAGAA